MARPWPPARGRQDRPGPLPTRPTQRPEAAEVGRAVAAKLVAAQRGAPAAGAEATLMVRGAGPGPVRPIVRQGP